MFFNVFIERICERKHTIHILHVGHVPIVERLVEGPKGAFGQRFARRVLDHVFDDGRSPRARKPREWEGYEEGASPCALERRHREVYEAAVGHALPEPIPYCGWVVES